MYTVKSQKSAGLTAVSAGLTALMGIRFASAVTAIAAGFALESENSNVLYLAVLYGILFLVFLVVLIRLAKTSKTKLTLNSGGMVYLPLFGAPKNLSYSDLQKVSIGGKTYVIYTNDGKKLVTFDDFHTEGAQEIISFLKQKGVKAEL